MSQYSETIGSFIRTGNYPLEANYIFASEDELKAFYEDPINKTTLHNGLLKVVLQDDTNKQSLYWVVESDEGLVFQKLIQDLDINNINTQLGNLSKKLDQEILDRTNKDNEIYGTDNIEDIDPSLNNIKAISEAIKVLQNNVQAIVGSEDYNIIEFLKTLDYNNLKEISDLLHKFFDTIDEEDTSINTLPELKEFLKGFEYTHNLATCLQELVNSIMGDPLPEQQFNTLRKLQDFVQNLESTSSHNIQNLQTELDQTQIGVGLNSDGSFSPDKETTYLKDATSVMNALKTLDQLVSKALALNLQVDNKDVIQLETQQQDGSCIISALLQLSNSDGNKLIKKSDGLYFNVISEYNNGILTLKVNDNIIAQHVLGFSALVESATYEPDQESIVIVFKLLDGQSQTVTIPVGTLIREWEVDNSGPTKVVELTKEVSLQGADKLSADVRLSSDLDNILEKDNNTLLVRGVAENIKYNNESLVTVIENIKDSISEAKGLEWNDL